MKIGLIGTGNISGIYLQNAGWLDPIAITAVADLRREAAEARAEQYGVPTVYAVDELLADPDIDAVLNLTTPDAHGSIALQALEAGKSVYNEKPLALSRQEARRLIRLAAENGLRVGCAPDTFMGAGLQTCRKLIDDGLIGRPVAATAFIMGAGPEGWHPNPDFFYKPGAGPMFDMGPYYLTALVHLLGPVAAVSGMVTKGREQRQITSQPLHGQMIDVEVPTHIAALMRFHAGAVATLVTSFDVHGHEHPYIEIYGTEASLSVPDPNFFGGAVRIKRRGEEDWEEMPHSHAYPGNMRGLGLADMADAVRNDRVHRASGEMAFHVLDLMIAFHESAERRSEVEIESRCAQPEPMAVDPAFGEPPEEK